MQHTKIANLSGTCDHSEIPFSQQGLSQLAIRSPTDLVSILLKQMGEWGNYDAIFRSKSYFERKTIAIKNEKQM